MTLVATVGRVVEVDVVEHFYWLLTEGAPDVLKAA